MSRKRVRRRPDPVLTLRRTDKSLDAVAESGFESYLACRRKTRYRNKTTALRVARKRMAMGVPYLRVYHCPYCNGWHLTKLESWEAPE